MRRVAIAAGAAVLVLIGVLAGVLIAGGGSDPSPTTTSSSTTATTAPDLGEHPVVKSTVETQPMDNPGDTADDPTIWVHPSAPEQSMIIGNDKKSSLQTYDLDGTRLQTISDDKKFWGNSDVRQSVTIGGRTIDVVAASHKGVALFTVDPATRQLAAAGDPDAPATSAEGLCMYHNPQTGSLYVINITIEGELAQWEVDDSDGDGLLELHEQRRFMIGSEAEGCVVDDETGALYVSQEDVALWRYSAEPGSGVDRVAVDQAASAGGRLAQDIEGVTLVDSPNGGYLIVSAQNSDTDAKAYFGLYRRGGENDFVSTFQVGNGKETDGCEHTDGVAATAANLGPAFPQGLFVCQDNNNYKPGSNGNQDFKLVPLQDIVALDTTP
ncbi:MAG: phytase [Actinomycetales bacterium]